MARGEAAPPAGDAAAPRAAWIGRAGLAASAASAVLTLLAAVAGPSVMEPALGGAEGWRPPWSLPGASPYLSVGLAAAALAAGAAGLALCLRAARRGWSVSPRLLLAAGIAVAAALALTPPFGSADHLSYAAYGRMAVTGHDPYTTTPAMLARLGDPVARAVQDWRGSPSVYGSLATGGQAFASLIGGTSLAATVLVLSLLNLLAFAGTGLLLHRLVRGSRDRQFRAALLWTANPLLLQVLVAGEHVDAQAIVFGVAAVAIFAAGLRPREPARSGARVFAVGAAAGAVAGLGFAVKVSMILVPAGLALGAGVWWWAVRPRPRAAGGPGALGISLAGLGAGFAATAAASFAPWGLQALRPALRAGSYVSVGSPWRAVRAALRLAIGEGAAGDAVKAGAIALMAALVVLFALRLASCAAERGKGLPRWAARFVPATGDRPGGAARPGRLRANWLPLAQEGGGPAAGRAGLAACATAGAFILVFAWLAAWPYVLPWYDGLAWALLALLPWGALDWLLLARTAALAFAYLPARGVAMPPGLDWLRPVFRNGAAPVVLLAVAVLLVMLLWPKRVERAQ